MKNYSKIFSVLSNQTRLDILEWLKNPHEAFKDVNSSAIITHMLNDKGGICVGDIAKKSGLAQSTTSKYLSDLESIGLLVSERHEKWTYYRRNENNIDQLCLNLKKDL